MCEWIIKNIYSRNFSLFYDYIYNYVYLYPIAIQQDQDVATMGANNYPGIVKILIFVNGE